jgi:hypothetical protein
MYVNSSYNRLARAIYHALHTHLLIAGYTYEKDLFSSSPLVSPPVPVCQEVFSMENLGGDLPAMLFAKHYFSFLEPTRGKKPT